MGYSGTILFPGHHTGTIFISVTDYSAAEYNLTVIFFKLRSMSWVGNVARMGGMRNSYKILVRKS
jgi:ABC-type iron transport system FetAB permease component